MRLGFLFLSLRDEILCLKGLSFLALCEPIAVTLTVAFRAAIGIPLPYNLSYLLPFCCPF